MEFPLPHLLSHGSHTTSTSILWNGPKTPNILTSPILGRHIHTFRIGKDWFIFSYSNGKACVFSLAVNNGICTTTNRWEKNLSSDITHFCSYLIDGLAYLVCYQQSDGHVIFYRIDADSLVELNQGEWAKGWTHLFTFEYAGNSYLVSYRQGSGAITIGLLGVGIREEMFCTKWSIDWTDFYVFYFLGEPYVLSYKGGIGTACLDKVTPKGFDPVMRKTWDSNWKRFAIFYLKGHPYLWMYKSEEGKGHYRIDKLFLEQNILITEGKWDGDCNHFCVFYE